MPYSAVLVSSPAEKDDVVLEGMDPYDSVLTLLETARLKSGKTAADPFPFVWTRHCVKDIEHETIAFVNNVFRGRSVVSSEELRSFIRFVYNRLDGKDEEASGRMLTFEEALGRAREAFEGGGPLLRNVPVGLQYRTEAYNVYFPVEMTGEDKAALDCVRSILSHSGVELDFHGLFNSLSAYAPHNGVFYARYFADAKHPEVARFFHSPLLREYAARMPLAKEGRARILEGEEAAAPLKILKLAATFGAWSVNASEYPVFLVPDKDRFPIVKYETNGKLTSLHINRESIDGTDSIHAFVRNLNVILGSEAARHKAVARASKIVVLQIRSADQSVLVALGDCGQGHAIMENTGAVSVEEMQTLLGRELSGFLKAYVPTVASFVEVWKASFQFTLPAGKVVAPVRQIDRFVRSRAAAGLPFAAWECNNDNVVLRYLAVDGCMGVDPAKLTGEDLDEFLSVEHAANFERLMRSPVTVVVRPQIASQCYDVQAADFEFKSTDVLVRFRAWMARLLKEAVNEEEEGSDLKKQELKEEDAFLDDYFAQVDEEEASKKKDEEEPAGEGEAVVTKPKSENNMLRQLEGADRALFAWPIKLHSKFAKYSSKCQKHRQPVVVSDKELAIFDSADTFGSYGEHEAYGTTAEKAAHNRYICPDVWCPISRVPMSFEQFRANAGQCPFPSIEEKPVIRQAKKKNMVSFFEPNLHPDGYCMPCCAIKKKPCTQQTADDPSASSNKYIKEDAAVLANGRFGTLPHLFFALFGNTQKRCGNRSKKSTGNINKDTTCFVRRGTRSGSYVEAALRARFGDAEEEVSWDQTCDLIERNLSPEVFLTLGGGSIAKIFVKQFVKSNFYIKDESVLQFLEDNAVYKSQFNVDLRKAATFQRERIVYGAMRMFFSYLRSKTIIKTPDIVECLLNSPTAYLNPDAHTIVTLDGVTASVIQHSLLLAHHRSRLFDGQLRVSFVYSSVNGFTRAFDNVCLIREGSETMHFDAEISSGIFAKLVHHLPPVDESVAVFERLLAGLLKIDQVVTHYVISIDFAIVGILCRSGVYVELPTVIEMVPLPPGITYLHEIDALDHVPEAFEMDGTQAEALLTALGFAVTGGHQGEHLIARHPHAPAVERRFPLRRRAFAAVAEAGELDHALLFHDREDNGHYSSSDQIQLFSALYRAKRVKQLKSQTLVSMVTSLRNTINPIPPAIRRQILSDHLSASCGTSAPDAAALSAALLEHGMKVLSQGFFNMLKPPSHRICVLQAGDIMGVNDNTIDVVRVVDKIVRPFVIPVLYSHEVKLSVEEEIQDTKVAFAKEASKMSRLQTAIFEGRESKPFTKWQKLLKGFAVFSPVEFDVDFLYKLYHHVSTRVGTMSKLGWSDLKRVATNFIANNTEMISIALSLNENLYRICNGSVELAAKIIKNGNYVPSYAEVCVLSHITNVRTIVFKRQTQDDDGLMCMNNKDTSVMYVLLQHRYDRTMKVDCFDVIVRDRPNIVILDGSLGKATRDFFVNRCSNANCWDEQCLKVTQQALKKKFA
jgi:hypothetical protein